MNAIVNPGNYNTNLNLARFLVQVDEDYALIDRYYQRAYMLSHKEVSILEEWQEVREQRDQDCSGMCSL